MGEKRKTVRPAVAAYLTITAVATGWAGGCAKPNAQTSTRQIFETFYEEQATGLNEQNLDKAYAHFAPDCIFIGEQNRSYGMTQERAEMTKSFGQAKSKMVFSTSIHALTLSPPSVTEVTVSLTRRITSTILWKKTMKPAPMEINAEIRDFWVKGARGWQIKREKIQTPQLLIDGKPFVP